MKFGLVALEIGEQKDRPTDTLIAIVGENLKHCRNNNNIIVLRPFVRVSRYQKKHSTTHHPGHHPIFIRFFHLYYTIHSILLLKLHAWQSFCTTSFLVLFGLPLGLEPSTSYSMHLFTQSVSSFRNK